MLKPNKSKKWLWWGLGGVIVILLIIASATNKGKNRGEKVYVEKAEKRTIIEKVSASGRIFPEKEIKISSDVSGQIVEMLVREGDSVKAGQLLCRVNPELYQDQVKRGEASLNASRAQYAQSQAQIEATRSRQGQLQAQREQNQAQLENLKNAFNRNEQLKKEGLLAESEYENSQAQLRQQEAGLKQIDANLATAIADLQTSEENSRAAQYNVQSSEASLSELRKTLNRTAIYAPGSGVVSKLSAEKGERVVGTAQMTGTEIMRIANLNAMEVQVNISENDIVKVRVGNTVNIDVDAYGSRKFKGTVTEIANTAANAINATTGQVNLTTDQVTNFVVKIRISPDSYSDLSAGGRVPFRPGMSASVDIFTQTVADAVSIPIGAVTMREDEAMKQKLAVLAKDGANNKDKNSGILEKEVVFVIAGDTARMVEVKTAIQDDRFIHVTEGLKGDEEVIAAPYNLIARRLKSGMKIQKVTEKELYESKDKK